MIELNALRRRLWPAIEKAVPQVMAYKEASDREFVGVIERSVPEMRRWLHGMENVYANNAAALKYYTVQMIEGDGDEPPRKPSDDETLDSVPEADLVDIEVDERGSYALRPDGRFGLWQLHYRLFPHERGTALSVHWELNPLVRPVKHYNGHKWSPHQGKQKAREHLSDTLDTDATVEGIVPYEQHMENFQ